MVPYKLIQTRQTYNCAHLRSTKEKKEENIWRKKIFFAEGTINGGGKRRIISGKGKYVFHRGEEKQRSLDTWSVEGGTG